VKEKKRRGNDSAEIEREREIERESWGEAAGCWWGVRDGKE